jgi:effector-binding domain-containing protein
MKIYSVLFLFFIFTGCSIPKLMLQEGKPYNISEWEGGNFIYLTYHFKGGNFDDAVNLLKQFEEIAKKRNLNENALGIFPDFKNWDLGMLAADKIDLSELSGYKLSSKIIPSGIYATMILVGHPENMFTQYDKFKKILIKDGYKIESSVYEIYSYDTFNNESIPIEKRIGKIRYKISK